MEKKVGLSPPWYTLHHKIVNTIGADPTVHVLPLRDEGATKYIDIVVTDPEELYPLACLVKPQHDMGNITVFVQVLDASGKVIKCEWPTGCTPPDCLYMVVTKGFKNNPLFVDAIIATPSVVWAVIKKVVIQFWNDDLSDFYGNFNGVAENVFKEVTQEMYPGDVVLAFTTENVK